MIPVDCEALHGGFPRQPINTMSSAAFLIVAWVLWRRGHRIAASAATLAGLGSVLFHGAPSGGSSWFHDIGLYAAVGVAAVEVWRQISDRRPPVVASGILGVGVVVWFLSRTGGPLCSPDSVVQGHSLWHVLSAVALLMLFWRSSGNPSSDGW